MKIAMWIKRIEWKSKLIDLLIVIIGISIAFKLNTWNENTQLTKEVNQYILSFQEENSSNHKSLQAALEFSKSNKLDLDTLKQLLSGEEYHDPRISRLVASMMGMADFNPTQTTMENISASGEFNLIKDIELRKGLIATYNSYNTTNKLEDLLINYIDKYVTPYFFENIRFSDFNASHTDYLESMTFENIIFGYYTLLDQLIVGYEKSLKMIEQLNDQLRRNR